MQMQQNDGAGGTAPSAAAGSAQAVPSHEPAIVIGAARGSSTSTSTSTGTSTSTSTAGNGATAAPIQTVAASARAKASAGVPAKDDCENPFVVDKSGIRHPKPHCFKK